MATLDPVVFDPATGRMVITYQTFVVRTPKHTILVDTCTGEDKGYPAPMDFPKQPWLDGFAAEGLRFEDITHVFCTHLHIDHCGWNTRLVNGRWVPTFPKAKYIFHKREYAAWEEATARGSNPPGNVWRYNCEPVVAAGQALLVDDDFALDDTITLQPTPGHAPCHCCINIRSGGQRAVVTGDLMHHALQVREPDWSTIFDWDPKMAAAARRTFFDEVAGHPGGDAADPLPRPNGRPHHRWRGRLRLQIPLEETPMARLPYLEKSDLKPEDQDLLKREITLHKALVNSPGAARAFSTLGQYIRYGAKLDPRLREAGNPAGRLAGALALRMVAPCQDRLRFRRHRRGYRGDQDRDARRDHRTRPAGAAGAARGAGSLCRARDWLRDLRRFARRARQRGDRRPHRHRQLLLRRGPRAGLARGGCRGQLHALSAQAPFPV
ncbi:MBL fold metallo-hydrolase [Dankookia sp. P2]|uniref:MBL fold metallo-hydrolase n=1 Tax=Dankookia sp. P2 TaxID=3423955 RepID=UPI003D67E63C